MICNTPSKNGGLYIIKESEHLHSGGKKMNNRQAKKYARNCRKHGYHSYIKHCCRKANTQDEHCCLRNNWRKFNKLPLLRSCL